MKNNYFEIKLAKEELDSETWKNIPGFENLYQASNLGRIRSIDRTILTKDNKRFISYKGMILKQKINNVGAKLVTLYINNKKHYKQVSRLILLTFVSPCPNGMECCHNDGNRQNNRLINLRWDTHLNNEKDKIKHGCHQYGEKNPTATLKNKQVRRLKKLWNTNKYKQIELSKLLNIPYKQVNEIILGRSWSSIN